MTFQEEILAGIPATALPEAKPYDSQINHAPKRKDILKPEEKVLAASICTAIGPPIRCMPVR